MFQDLLFIFFLSCDSSWFIAIVNSFKELSLNHYYLGIFLLLRCVPSLRYIFPYYCYFLSRTLEKVQQYNKFNTARISHSWISNFLEFEQLKHCNITFWIKQINFNLGQLYCISINFGDLFMTKIKHFCKNQ